MSAPMFYVIGESDYESHTTLRLSVERQGRTGSQLIRGDFPPEPISAKRHLGSETVDYTDMSIRIVSRAFRDAVARHGLSGAVFAPLTVDGNSSRWYLMGVTGSCGPFDYSATERFERVIHHSGGGEWRGAYLRGFAIDPGSWSGDDFFLPQRVNSVVVTQHAVVALGDARLSNVQFSPTSGYEIQESYILKSAQSDSDS
jgi:hypothetical protein